MKPAAVGNHDPGIQLEAFPLVVAVVLRFEPQQRFPGGSGGRQILHDQTDVMQAYDHRSSSALSNSGSPANCGNAGAMAEDLVRSAHLK
jgi:hypothetical protein